MIYKFTVTLANEVADLPQSVDNLREGIERILNDAVRYPLRGQTRLLLGVCRELTVTAEAVDLVTVCQQLVTAADATAGPLLCRREIEAIRNVLIQMGKDK